MRRGTAVRVRCRQLLCRTLREWVRERLGGIFKHMLRGRPARGGTTEHAPLLLRCLQGGVCKGGLEAARAHMPHPAALRCGAWQQLISIQATLYGCGRAFWKAQSVLAGDVANWRSLALNLGTGLQYHCRVQLAPMLQLQILVAADRDKCV